MPTASRTPPIKEALERMEKAEDEVRKFLRRAAILLVATRSNTRSNTTLQATYKALTESLDHYREQSHELRHVIKETRWDNESWPELHDEHLIGLGGLIQDWRARGLIQDWRTRETDPGLEGWGD